MNHTIAIKFFTVIFFSDLLLASAIIQKCKNLVNSAQPWKLKTFSAIVRKKKLRTNFCKLFVCNAFLVRKAVQSKSKFYLIAQYEKQIGCDAIKVVKRKIS